jgi:hypothetical protein
VARGYWQRRVGQALAGMSASGRGLPPRLVVAAIRSPRRLICVVVISGHVVRPVGGARQSGACSGSDARPAAGSARRAAKLDRMSSREQSLAMFVVQRSFRRVRRSYDPGEVERHLELVSRWFTSTRVGEALSHVRAEMQERERMLDEREAELARAVEGARLEAEGLLEGARRPAEADARAAEQALAAAREEAAAIRTATERMREELLDEARVEAAAAEIVAAARAQAAQESAAAREEATAVVAEARREAEAELAGARRASEQLLAAARAEAVDAAERLRAQAEDELAAYVARRRREADRLVQGARRERGSRP